MVRELRSYMLQLKILHAAAKMKVPAAATMTQRSQTNKYSKKKKIPDFMEPVGPEGLLNK